MKDVMLDFETFGNGKNKCICQVGAVYFDNITGELGKSYSANIDATSHEKYGGKLDAPTVYWWLQQSEAARLSLITNPRDIKEVFEELNVFFAEASRIWSHATFDFVTLTDTYRQLNIKPMFRYKNGLDLRTLTYLGGVKVDKIIREGVHHNALDDCKHQVKYCVAALNAIKTSKNIIRFVEGLLNEKS